MVGRQVRRGGLIERDAPMVTRTNIQEALRDLLTCLWRAHRVPKHDGDLVHQSVMDQSCSIGSQEMAILERLTEEGNAKVEQLMGIGNLYDPEYIDMLHHIYQALKAYHLYKLDVDYMIKDGEIIIEYKTNVDHAKSTGIEIVPFRYRNAVSINCGGGIVWPFTADKYYRAGQRGGAQIFTRPGAPVAGLHAFRDAAHAADLQA